MSTQVAIRFSDEQLAYLDRLVKEQRAASRAEAVRLAPDISRRAERDAADLAAYSATAEDGTLDELNRYAIENLDV